MSFFDRFRKNSQEKEAKEVKKESIEETVDAGTDVEVSVRANDGSKIAIILTRYLQGHQPKNGKIRVKSVYVSYISKDHVYNDEPIQGDIDIWEKSEGGKKYIEVLSFAKGLPVRVAVSIAVKIPGDVLKGTVRLDVFLDGEGRKLAWLLEGSDSVEQTRDTILYEMYLSELELERIIRESVVDIASQTANVEYKSIDEINKAMSDNLTNNMWFIDRGLSVRSVFFRFELTELDKIKDKLERVKYMTMDQKADLEAKKVQVKGAAEEKQLFSSVDNTPDGNDDADTQSAKDPEQI